VFRQKRKATPFTVALLCIKRIAFFNFQYDSFTLLRVDQEEITFSLVFPIS